MIWGTERVEVDRGNRDAERDRLLQAWAPTLGDTSMLAILEAAGTIVVNAAALQIHGDPDSEGDVRKYLLSLMAGLTEVLKGAPPRH